MITFRTDTTMHLIKAWRNDLNRLAPCVVIGVSFFGDQIDTRTGADPLYPRGAPVIWLDLAGEGQLITAANLAAALGQNSVRFAASKLVEIAAGRASDDMRSLCADISSAVIRQVEQYPLDRPDLRRPSEGGPS